MNFAKRPTRGKMLGHIDNMVVQDVASLLSGFINVAGTAPQNSVDDVVYGNNLMKMFGGGCCNQIGKVSN